MLIIIHVPNVGKCSMGTLCESNPGLIAITSTSPPLPAFLYTSEGLSGVLGPVSEGLISAQDSYE